MVGIIFLSCAQKPVSFKLISQEAFGKLATEKIQLIDVRTPAEHKKGFIEGAILINFYDTDFSAKVMDTFDKEQPLYIYCASGGRSKKAASKLLADGFTKIYDLEGGYLEYHKNQ